MKAKEKYRQLLINKLIQLNCQREDIENKDIDTLENVYYFILAERGLDKKTILYPQRTAFNQNNCFLCNKNCGCHRTILVQNVGFSKICCDCMNKLNQANKKIKGSD